jgi:catechol 2,3-dioxygenase-like lactoylglutathione lyase family enzyme
MLRGLNHITITVIDLEQSFNFYVNLLGMVPRVRWDQGAYLTLGEVWFCLSWDQVKPSQDYCHIALDIAEHDFNTFAERLRAADVIEWKQNTSEGESVYFLDPNGHKLEIHSGNLQSRLQSLKLTPYKGLVWF